MVILPSLNPTSSWLFGIAVFLLLSTRFAGRLLRSYLLRRYTTVEGLPLLGAKREKKIRGTAVVCGGSISGLLTARVCSDHFSNVILIDPELQEVQRSKPSSRIAQFDSLHGYLTFVLEGFRRLWPDFDRELSKAGGFVAPGDVKPFFGGTLMPAPYDEYKAQSKKLPETLFIRRPNLENLLRKLVLSPGKTGSNIHTMTGTVRGLHVTQDVNGRCVNAVVLRGQNNEEITINDPTLVLDCSGDSQAGFKWLKKAGYEFPPSLRLEYDQRLYYVTVTFTVTDDMRKRIDKILVDAGQEDFDRIGWLYTFVPHYNMCNEGFVLGKMDNNTMQLCCGGWGEVALPLSAGEIEGYVTSVRGREPVPDWLIEIVHILADEGDAKFKPLKIRPCSFIRYQEAKDLPFNFVALGDAMLQLNPIYAQGCSKAMMGAVTLNSLLAACTPVSRSGSKGAAQDEMPANFGREYFREVSNHGQALWDSTKTFDYGFTSTRPVAGETLNAGSLARWYLDLFIEAALKDQEAASVMWHIRMLLAPPSDMFTPGMLWKIGSYSLRSKISSMLRSVRAGCW